MRLLTIDTETTGLQPAIHQILTVGLLVIEVEKDHLKMLESLHIPVKHKCYRADKKALMVNRICLERHHKISIEPKMACEKISRFIEENNLGSTPLLGHNIAFDLSFLTELFRKEKKRYPFAKKFYDTMFIWNALKRQGRVPSHLNSTLQTIAEYFKIDYSNAHDALSDCEITSTAYHKMIQLQETF
ncbi:3'-5' exonuclease [Candidatus Pacearchaeota archaeon]|nr:MAG: 3'-5' exonuclease [Candidatus Pacearchaeota archaeon]